MRHLGASPRGRVRIRAHAREDRTEEAGKARIIRYIASSAQFNGGSLPQA